jgi:hypothetical protein
MSDLKETMKHFNIAFFTFLCSNIFQQHPHIEYIYLSLSDIRYFKACGCYRDFLDRWLLLTRKLLK